MRTQASIFSGEPQHKRSKSMAIIEIVKKEINKRQNNGFIRKDFSDKDKNKIAMKFIELYNRVRDN